MINKVFLSGYLTRGCEGQLKESQNGKKYINFVMVQKYNSIKSTFINCTAFGFSAEYLSEHGKKGSRIVIEGLLIPVTNPETNKQSGLKVSVLSFEIYPSSSQKEKDDVDQPLSEEELVNLESEPQIETEDEPWLPF